MGGHYAAELRVIIHRNMVETHGFLHVYIHNQIKSNLFDYTNKTSKTSDSTY